MRRATADGLAAKTSFDDACFPDNFSRDHRLSVWSLWLRAFSSRIILSFDSSGAVACVLLLLPLLLALLPAVDQPFLRVGPPADCSGVDDFVAQTNICLRPSCSK